MATNTLTLRLHQIALAPTLHRIRACSAAPVKISSYPQLIGQTLREIDTTPDLSVWGGWLRSERCRATLYEWIVKNGQYVYVILCCRTFDAALHKVEEKNITVTVDHLTHHVIKYTYYQAVRNRVTLRGRSTPYLQCIRYSNEPTGWQRRLYEAALQRIRM